MTNLDLTKRLLDMGPDWSAGPNDIQHLPLCLHSNWMQQRLHATSCHPALVGRPIQGDSERVFAFLRSPSSQCIGMLLPPPQEMVVVDRLSCHCTFMQVQVNDFLHSFSERLPRLSGLFHIPLSVHTVASSTINPGKERCAMRALHKPVKEPPLVP